MTEATFGKVLILVPPLMQTSRVNRNGLHSYLKTHRVSLISSFLVDVPTMQCSWLMYQQPTSPQVDCYLPKTGTDEYETKFVR